jgi:NAD(P)-dependent dehydrogenase (short-subunit alcohol dehydrogenase family)
MYTNRFGRLPAVILSLLMLLGATLNAHAGGHVQKWPQQPDIKLDPTLRTLITGTVLITGSNRGIGLRLASNYAERGWTVIATARKPKKADDLNALAKKHPNVTVEYLDLLDHKGIDKLAKKLQDVPIDVLLNNAAMLGDPAAQDFGDLDCELMEQVYAVNTVGTMKMAEAFLTTLPPVSRKRLSLSPACRHRWAQCANR